MESLRLALRIPFDLNGIVVEGGDLFLPHAVAREPARDMHVAQSLDVGQHLVEPAPVAGHDVAKSIADKNDSRLPIAIAFIEIDRTDARKPRNFEPSGQLLQTRHGGKHRFFRLLTQARSHGSPRSR